MENYVMSLTPARIRALILPAVLIAGLFGATSASAAEDTSASRTSATIAGSGVLAAHGDGTARLAGSYSLTGSLEGGTLSIRGIDRWSSVRVTGWVSKTRFADGTVLYRFGDQTGHYWIVGRSLLTTIESDGMRFSAAGHGRATLIGTGTFWVNGHGPLPWTSPGTETDF
jgi:hypothetical protein